MKWLVASPPPSATPPGGHLRSGVVAGVVRPACSHVRRMPTTPSLPPYRQRSGGPRGSAVATAGPAERRRRARATSWAGRKSSAAGRSCASRLFAWRSGAAPRPRRQPGLRHARRPLFLVSQGRVHGLVVNTDIRGHSRRCWEPSYGASCLRSAPSASLGGRSSASSGTRPRVDGRVGRPAQGAVHR